jgi:hypothetical protein
LLDHSRGARNRGANDLGGERGGFGGLEGWENWSSDCRHGDVDNERVELPKPRRLMLGEGGEKLW